jgi:hypothetical protein
VLCTYALENMLVFVAVKAAQGIRTKNINLMDGADLVPELFKPNRSVGLTFRLQERLQ